MIIAAPLCKYWGWALSRAFFSHFQTDCEGVLFGFQLVVSCEVLAIARGARRPKNRSYGLTAKGGSAHRDIVKTGRRSALRLQQSGDLSMQAIFPGVELGYTH